MKETTKLDQKEKATFEKKKATLENSVYDYLAKKVLFEFRYNCAQKRWKKLNLEKIFYVSKHGPEALFS